MKIRYHLDALKEIKQATRFYSKHDGSRSRFASEIESVLNQINRSPTHYRTISPKVRRALCPVFPYAIIIAVMHLRRDPDNWRYRIQ